MVEKYQPLYLKYRPQSLADLVGQKAVAQTLTNAIDHDRICHAYLFTGPRGTGKTSSARILAKSLNCEKGPTATPCQVCTACIEIREGNSPAVFELDAASNNSVDDARSLIERAPLVAQGGRFKLYIIDECHMLTKEAFNALLKTIEEPPDKVIFILATTEEHKVPPTIISRCQRLMFRLVNQGELKEHLRNVAKKENINIEEEALELVARRSAGGLRDALGLLDQASLLSTQSQAVSVSDLLALMGAVQEDVLLQISASIKENDGNTVLKSVQALLLDGREPAVVVQELAKHFLNLAKACYNTEAKNSDSGADHAILGSALYLDGLAKQSKDFAPAEIAQIVELLDKLEQTVRRSSQGSLNLEMGLLSICHRHDILLFKEVSERLANVEAAVAGNDFVPPASAKASPDKYAKTGSPAPSVSVQPPAYTAPVQAPAYSNGAHDAPPARPQPVPQAVAPAPATSAPATSAPAASVAVDPVVQASSSNIVMGDDEDDEEQEPVNLPISTREPPSDLSMGDDDDIEPEPARAVATASSAHHAPPMPTSVATEDGPPVGANELGVSLDEFWQDLKDELQKRHMPTFAIVQTHAFILAFEKSDIVIGVRKENFQKMLEAKAEHIKTAGKALLGRTVTTRIKVVADPGPGAGPASGAGSRAPAPSSPRPANAREHQSSPGSSEDPERAKANQSSFDSDNSNRNPAAQDERPRTPAQPASALNSARPGAPAPSGEKRPPDANAPSRVTTRNDELPPEGNLLKEAYKLFEGPGSRLIG
ncbi:MAG: DNA polymerase III subunit gamma/tau [Candidatus Obscuribacterales bacterium]|nr:DNA polymerase III subunit gamma/tau [Candidatus Obscuribacterales bacterium]